MCRLPAIKRLHGGEGGQEVIKRKVPNREPAIASIRKTVRNMEPAKKPRLEDRIMILEEDDGDDFLGDRRVEERGLRFTVNNVPREGEEDLRSRLGRGKVVVEEEEEEEEEMDLGMIVKTVVQQVPEMKRKKQFVEVVEERDEEKELWLEKERELAKQRLKEKKEREHDREKEREIERLRERERVLERKRLELRERELEKIREKERRKIEVGL